MKPGQQLLFLSLSRAKQIGCALLLSAFAYSCPAQAQSGSADEYEIRAAMLLNIARFVEWPDSKSESNHPDFLICVLGSDPIDSYADRYLDHQSLGSKQTRLLHIHSTAEARSCNMLYYGTNSRKQVEKSESELEHYSVLTVSESSCTAVPEQGIGLPAVAGQIKIEVNLGVAQRSKLQISSKLLHLAQVNP